MLISSKNSAHFSIRFNSALNTQVLDRRVISSTTRGSVDYRLNDSASEVTLWEKRSFPTLLRGEIESDEAGTIGFNPVATLVFEAGLHPVFGFVTVQAGEVAAIPRSPQKADHEEELNALEEQYEARLNNLERQLKGHC